MRILRCLVIGIVVGLCGLSEVRQTSADFITIHLFAGQSNAVGSGHESQWTSGQQTNADVLYSHNSGTNAFHQETWDQAQFRLTTNGAIRRWYGAEMTYAHGIADRGNQAILKFARGGTGLHNDWARDGSVRQQFLDYADQEIQLLKDMGHKVRIGSLVWIQGEADAGSLTNAENYDENLLEFVNDVRAHFQSQDMIFKYNLAHQDLNRGYVEQLRQSQRDYLKLDGKAYLVNIDDLTLKADQVHFTSATFQSLGFRFASIPEPSTMICPLIGLVLLVKRKRRKSA